MNISKNTQACLWCTMAATVLLSAAASTIAGDTETDPANKYAWAENVGWANAAPTYGGVMVHFDGTSGYLTGFAWGENVGWIKLGDNTGGPYANNSPSDWGVNLDDGGNLSGYAWGENIGWIKYAHAQGGVTIDLETGWFDGFAWAENIGWFKFQGNVPGFGVRTLAFDTQPEGTPNWWLDHHQVTEGYDEGDDVPAWQEYVADTDPNDDVSYLRITAITNAPTGMNVVFWPSSTRRYYTLTWCADLQAGSWNNVANQICVPGSGDEQALCDTNTAAAMSYAVEVTVSP